MNLKRVILICGLILAVSADACILEARPAPKDGVVREHFTNGNRRSELHYKNEQLIRRRTFYENGRTMLDMRYKDEQLIYIKTFHENGRLKSIWTRKSGREKYFDEDGRLTHVVDHNHTNILQDYKSSYIYTN